MLCPPSLTVHDLAEDHVTAVEMRRGGGGDEELAPEAYGDIHTPGMFTGAFFSFPPHRMHLGPNLMTNHHPHLAFDRGELSLKFALVYVG